MENEFDAVMAKRTDTELIKILNSPIGDYQPAAMEAAKREYGKRDLSLEAIGVANEEIERELLADEIKANEKLSENVKIFAFLFPGLVLFMFAGLYKADGYTRKSKELLKSTTYGFCFYVGIIILLKIIASITD